MLMSQYYDIPKALTRGSIVIHPVKYKGSPSTPRSSALPPLLKLILLALNTPQALGSILARDGILFSTIYSWSGISSGDFRAGKRLLSECPSSCSRFGFSVTIR
jgi:hypothetical protein